ncbi:hypothetical protein N431DRAFT_554693 [Stipitochalara longipes BDJ]|nr:hypothetical protein N431DRAFT_554693 [Stipitochalara longipes BDJ]
MNSSAPGFWFQLLPGVVLSQVGGFGTPTPVSRRHLGRRDWDLISIASALTENLSQDISIAASNVQTAFNTASTAIDAAVSAAIGVVVASLNALSPFTLGPFPFSATPNNNATTDFGAGVQLTSTSGTYKGAAGTLSTYCIGCGVTGTFSVVGQILFDAEEGITEAVFDLTGSIHAQIEIAVIATVAASASDQKNLFTQGLPDLTIPGFLVLGPAIALDIGATVSVEALGGLAAGYQLNWPDITAHFDILNDDYSASGLMPVGTPIADTELNITSTATLYGLVTLSFGIDVMGGKYKANVGLVDKPEIDAFTEVIVYTDPQIAAMDDGTVICVGENFTLGITDSAYADVVWGGVGTKPISTKTYPLTTWAGPTFTTCFGSLSTIHHTSTMSSSSPTPTPTEPGGGDCDPLILADGSCCVLPDNWVDSNPYGACTIAATETWKEAIIAECGTSKACYDVYWDPLGLVTLNCTMYDRYSYAFELCNSHYWYETGKWEALKFWGEYGKRSVEERNAGSVDVLRSGVRGLQDRQAGFVNIVGHGTRNATTKLAWTEDGNLVASQNGTLFATLNGNVIGDTNGRFLHYYELSMGLSEISRLRLASLDMMPVGSVLLSLAPMAVGLASPSLVAFTSSGAYYYIITCTITGQFPKLFLARQVALGIELLMTPGLQNTLTGGVVETCGLLPWTI